MTVIDQDTVRVGTLAELKQKGVIVVRGADRPIAVFYNDGAPAAVDNRCPHMGFPMHKGTVKEGLVTCHWHEARFDLCSGCTFDLFADDLPAFDTEVRDGVVYVAPTPRHPATREHYLKRLRRGMEQSISLIQGKALIALLKGGVAPDEMVRHVAEYGCANQQQWQSGMTLLTAVANLLPHLDEETAYYALFKATARVAQDCANAPWRRSGEPLETNAHSMDTLKQWLRYWTKVRQGDAAERTLLTAIREKAAAEDLTELLCAAAGDRPYASTGHVVDANNKGIELLGHVGAEAAERVLPLLLPAVVTSRGGEEDASWHYPIDILEPLRQVEEALPEVLERAKRQAVPVAGSLPQVLLGEDPVAILHALRDALAEGTPPAEMAQQVCHAAAMRLCRFAPGNEITDWFNPVHTYIYANAVYQSILRIAVPETVRTLLHAAVAVYMDRFLNVPPAKLPGERSSLDDLPATGPELLDGLLSALDQKHDPMLLSRLVARYLRGGHALRPLIDRLTYAVVREDLDFHATQVLEAAVAQSRLWPAGSLEFEHHFIALARYLASQCPTQRGGLQTARIALRLHRGEALYEEE